MSNEHAVDLILKRIHELEEMIEFLEPMKDKSSYNRKFNRHLTQTLRINQEIYSYLVGFASSQFLN